MPDLVESCNEADPFKPLLAPWGGLWEPTAAYGRSDPVRTPQDEEDPVDTVIIVSHGVTIRSFVLSGPCLPQRSSHAGHNQWSPSPCHPTDYSFVFGQNFPKNMVFFKVF